MKITAPVTLSGLHVRLEPLIPAHADALAAAVDEPQERPWFANVPTRETLRADVEMRLALHAAGSMVPFAIRSGADDRLVGETTFCNIDAASPRTEIGHTWLAPSARGTVVNAEAKFLLLKHAFEACEVIAVELRTHFHNHRSRAAIERLGAKQDGVLRNHRFGPDGTLRDTVVYSILPYEWPTVRTGLQARIERHASA